MKNVVALYEGKEARVGTFSLWEKFGYYEHRALKKVIFENRELFESKGKLITASTVAGIKKVGQPDKSYLLNERQFILLVMLVKNTPESIEFKSRVEIEFNRMRKTISNLVAQRQDANWMEARKNGITIYKQKTEVIKEFVEYATRQGSKNSKMYFTNFSKMENSALFFFEQKYPNMREVMNIKQLMQVCTCDDVIEKALKDGMEKNLDYHDIYKLAKERVVAFSEIIGKSPILLLELKK